MTDAEIRLWQALRGNSLSVKFRRQAPIGPFFADFVCLEKRLIVEVDGGQHAENVRDQERDAWLNQEGYRVLRFWNNEVLTHLDGVLGVIAGELAKPVSPRPIPQSGNAPGSRPRSGKWPPPA